MKIISNGKVRVVGPHGATFIPHVSKDCDLSWTNNGGLENPDTINIQGPKGDPGVSSKKNLLDNWYFPRPINQRAVRGTITATDYFIDRWKLVSGSVKITNDGLVLNGIIEQILEFPVNDRVVASVLTTSGLISASYIDNAKTFRIVSSGSTIIAAKLERGNSQTLVDPDGSLADDPPNYVFELLKCQRYQKVITGNANTSFSGITTDNGRIQVMNILLAVPFAKTPTVIYDGATFTIRGVSGYWTFATYENPTAPTNTLVYYSGGSEISLGNIFGENVMSPNNTPIATSLRAGTIILDANL